MLPRSITVNYMFFFFWGPGGLRRSLIISVLVTGVLLLLFYR